MSDPLDIRWLAGFIDGEGCFSVSMTTRPGVNNPYYRCVMVVGQGDRPILERIRDTIGAGVVTELINHSAQTIGTKPFWHYRLSGQAVASFIRLVLPHLVLKRDVAAELLDLLDLIAANGGRRLTPEEIAARGAHVARIRALNGRQGKRRTSAEIAAATA